MNIKVNTAVIGAGISGMSAAIEAGGKKGNKVIILEKQNKPGRKLLASGNGRCNIGNTNMSPKFYHGDRAIIDSVLKFYTKERAERFYRSLGLLLYTDSEGRIYPYSNRADTVLECLKRKLKALNVDILSEFAICDIKKENGLFHISSKTDNIYAENIIFASGSRAAPYLGADGSGYDLLSRLGLNDVRTFPSLCPVECREKYSTLKGIRAKGTVNLYADGKNIISEPGEIQFTDTGISGICVFNISRYVNEFFALGTVSGNTCKKISITLDLMPGYSHSDIIGYLRKCRSIFGDDSCKNILSAALNQKLSETLVKVSRVSERSCRDLDEDDLSKIADNVKAFMFTPSCTGSFKNAQVCAGGYDSIVIDPKTLMCRKVKNLFICGEMLDADGICGGYNIHFAFGSGILAAKNINR